MYSSSGASESAALYATVAVVGQLLERPGAGILIGMVAVMIWTAVIQPRICDHCKRREDDDK